MIVIVAPISGSYGTLEMLRSQPDEQLRKGWPLTRRLIVTCAPSLFLLLVLGASLMDPNTLANVAIASITVIAFALTGIGVVYSLRNEVKTLSVELKSIKDELHQFRNVAMLQGRHDERLSFISATQINQGRRLDDLTRRVNTFMDLKLGEDAKLIDEEEA